MDGYVGKLLGRSATWCTATSKLTDGASDVHAYVWLNQECADPSTPSSARFIKVGITYELIGAKWIKHPRTVMDNISARSQEQKHCL